MNIVVKWFKTNLSNRQVVVLVGFLALAFFSLYFFGDMIAPVLAAVVIAFLLDGLVKRLTKRGMPHLLSVIITFVSFLVGAFLIFFAVLPPIAAQVGNFVASLPGMVTNLNEQASKLPELLPGIVDQAWVDGLMAGLQNEILEL
ncbi:MAG: AI-2E family transporter, partial [Sphingomonadales bacterium]